MTDSLRSSRSSRRCASCRTRSMTRAKRVEVESTRVPQAEISTAGVIIALSTASAAEGSLKVDSQFTRSIHNSEFTISKSEGKQAVEVATEDQRLVRLADAKRFDRTT